MPAWLIRSFTTISRIRKISRFPSSAITFEGFTLDCRSTLEGILEPKSRLSKAIWFHLRYNETHRDCARMLLFECRSNRSFYEHESYELLREYAELLLSILTKGIEDGDFRDDVDMCVMRDLILGALDWETLRSLSTPEGKHKFSDVQEIMDLVYAMIGTRGVERKEPDKSKRIITAAEKLFSEKGYRQTSVAEIARQADVAEGTVYEYFKNKEDLLFSIPKLRFREHVDSLTELFQIRAPMRKLRRFIRYHYVLYLTQPDFLKTFLLDLQLNPRFYETEALAFFSGVLGNCRRHLGRGQERRKLPRLGKQQNLSRPALREAFLGWLSSGSS